MAAKLLTKVPRWLIGPIVTAVAVIISMVTDLGANVYFSRIHSQWLQDIAIAKSNVAAYRRPIQFGTPIDENAAVWYRQSFSKMKVPSSDDAHRLRTLVEAGYEKGTVNSPIDGICAVTSDVPVHNALRCTHCDWTLGYGVSDSTLFPSVNQAATIGNCLILNGHRAASARDSLNAARLYVEALSFSCDLGMGNLIMNVVGIGIAKNAVQALLDLLLSDNYDEATLDRVADGLSSLNDNLPTIGEGVRLDRLQLTDALVTEARTAASLRKRGLLSMTVPWQTYAAWSVTQRLALLAEFEKATSIIDQDERARVIEHLRDYAANSTSPVLQEALSDSWLSAVESGAHIADDSRGLLAAVELERWHNAHFKYPSSISELSNLLERDRLSYEPMADGSGYRLREKRSSGLGRVLIDRKRRGKTPVTERWH